MIGIKRAKMSRWKLCINFLMILILLTSVASASLINKMKDQEEGYTDGNENVKEEIVGISKDGKDFLVKRVTSHPIKDPVKLKAASGSGCYKLMPGDIRWSSPNVPYIINPTSSGLDLINTSTIFSASSGTWDASTSWNLFGTYAVDSTRGYGFDGYNTLLFGALSDNRVIARTTTWYYRFNRQIVEFDIVFNTYFSWGDATSDQTKMDLQNIATHELGHGIGLSDLYNSCVDETMYGYSTIGETKKRTLEAGDIAGLQNLYG